MKKQVIIACGLVVLAFVVLFSLDATIDMPNRHKNGFNRSITAPYRQTWSKKLHFDLPGICGVSGDTIFLTNGTAGTIYSLSQNAIKPDTFNITEASVSKFGRNFYTFVNYPEAYVLGGNARQLIQGDLKIKEFKPVSVSIGGPVLNSVKTGPQSFILRMIDSATFNACFIKINAQGKFIMEGKNLSVPLADGGFTYDGVLSYDKNTHLLFFVPHYNNNIICFDTSLNMRYRGHTIDTNRTAIKKIIRNGRSITYNSPPVMINVQSWANNGILYVRSELKADNENNEQFSEHIVIDKYSIQTGSYIGSFYLPRASQYQPIQFFMQDQEHLLVLYHDKLVKYCQTGKSK